MKQHSNIRQNEAESGGSESESGQPGRTTDPAHTTSAARFAAFASSRGRYYAVFLAVFCAVLIISNISATKVAMICRAKPVITAFRAALKP